MRPRPSQVIRCLTIGAFSAELAGAAPLAAQSARSASATPEPAMLAITAAVVLHDMTVRPLPLLGLEMVRSDRPDTVRVHTELDGKVSEAVAPGSYVLRSTTPVRLEGKSYSWSLSISVARIGITSVELTNVNADSTSTPVPMARQVAPAQAVFDSIRRGVFQVEAGLGHGSGFLIAEAGGLVVTNDHVVANSTEASVYLDSVTRVPAQVVVRDRNADLALLRIPEGKCAGCPRLSLAHPKPGEQLVLPGESVLAIGYPLHQEITLTTGIASSIREGAIISDVNINHGNSGGPMLNLAGEVVGVNAFMDFSNQGGPGISGAISIDRLLPLLAQVPTALAELAPLEDRNLPTMPLTTYPLPILKSFADTADRHSYTYFSGREAGNFLVSILTPTFLRVLQKEEENDVAKDRRKREAKAGVAADERYSELRESHDWEQYVGDASAPVVSIYIEPKLGETFWSALGRGLESQQYGRSVSAARMKFQGDVRGARFYRNGIEIEPIRGGHGPQKMVVDNQWIELKDVADRGYYVLPVMLFQPDSAGAPPMVSIVVQDLKNPKALSSVDVWGETAARVWNDFAPYFHAVHPDFPFRLANPKLSTKIPLVCDPETARCTVKTRK